MALLVCGLLYGMAEFARQAWWMPSPPGVPGDSGGDLLAHLALGSSAVALPGLVAWLVLSGLPPWLSRVRWFLTAVSALLPTTMLVCDRAAELLRWEWTLYQVGGFGYYLRLFALAMVVVVVPALLIAVRRPGRTLPRIVNAFALVLIVASPFVLVMQLRAAGPGTGPDAWPDAWLDAGPNMTIAPRPSSSTPNVLLITVDTLRQDALSAYGGPVELPTAMQQAQPLDGWSVASWTKPAMASLFTGLAPTGHGADQTHTHSSTLGWWPEQWQQAGWATAAVTTNTFLRRRFTFDRGFAHFEHAEELGWLEPIARTFWAEWWQRRAVDRGEPDRADRRVKRAQRWLQRADPSRPWLLWVHLMDPHLPYHLRGAQGAPSVDERPAWAAPLEAVLQDDRFLDFKGAREGRVVTTEQEREALHRLYLTEVDFAMHWVAELIETARSSAGERGLVWVLTSDHGEEFWEDGGFEHGHSLHDTVLRVPLLVGGNASPRLAVDAGTRLRLIDLGPLLTSRIGPGSFDARAWSGLLEGEPGLDAYALGQNSGPLTQLPLLAEGMLYGPPRSLVVAPDGRALERQDDTGVLTPQRRWSFDAASPDSTATGELRALLLELDLWRERNAGRGVAVQYDDELVRRLRAVGYLN